MFIKIQDWGGQSEKGVPRELVINSNNISSVQVENIPLQFYNETFFIAVLKLNNNDIILLKVQDNIQFLSSLNVPNLKVD